MQQVSPEEATAHLAELMDAAMRGERVVIARDDRHAVQLIQVSPARQSRQAKPTGKADRQSRQAGSAKSLIVIREDFDAPLDDFAKYVP